MRMKLNKKLLAFNVLATLFATEAMSAPITVVRTKTDPDSNSSGSSSGVTTDVKTSKATEERVLNVKAQQTAQCTLDQGPSKHFPLKLLSLLTRDGDDITIEKKGDGVASVKIPAIINVCGKFVPELKQDRVSKNVTVLMTLVGTRTSKEMVDGVEKATVTPNAELTYKEFEDCLAEKKILVDGKINHDTIPNDKYSSTAYTLDYEFDKKKDISKSISLTFGFPVAFGKDYGAKHAFDKDVPVPGESCMVAENVSDKKFLLNKGREDYIQSFIEACKSGNATEIEMAKRDLGNAEALRDIADKIRAELDAGYLVAVRKDVEKIYKELEKIEDKLNDPKELNEKKARELMAKYTEQLKLLDSIFLDKAITRIKELLAQREKLDEDSTEIAAIDAEIKTLNEQIGEFHKRPNLASVYNTVEHFYLRGPAEIVEDIYLKSQNYSLVYAGDSDGRGKALTIEDAHKRQVEGFKKFKPVLAEWEEAFQVRKGNQSPVIKAQREIQTANMRKNSRLQAFRKKEMEDYNSYCTANIIGQMKNKTRCTEFFTGKNKRERAQLKRYEADMKYISSKERKLSKFAGAYGEYESKRNALQEKSEFERYEGASSSGYEDTFDERFSSYSGSSQPGFVDPNMFNMGAPSFGQPQMFQQQPQMMMQQQMMPGFQQPMIGNQMGGGWPNM